MDSLEVVVIATRILIRLNQPEERSIYELYVHYLRERGGYNGFRTLSLYVASIRWRPS